MNFDNLTDQTLLDRMEQGFHTHCLTPLVGWEQLSLQEWYDRLWRRWLTTRDIL